MVNVRIPIIIKSKFELLKIIPIPIKRDQSNFIQNFEPKQLVKLDSVIAEIFAQCTQVKGLVVCHNTALSQLLQIDTCIEAILKDVNTEGICTYKKLQYKSQLIQMAAFLLHWINSFVQFYVWRFVPLLNFVWICCVELLFITSFFQTFAT